MSAARAVATVTPRCLTQRLGFHERGEFHPLHHQLRDPVSAADMYCRTGIVVDEANLDLTPVSGIHSTWGVHDRKTGPNGETRPRVNQSDGALREGDGDARTHENPLAGLDRHINRGEQVSPGVAWMGSRWERQARIEPHYGDR